MHHRQSKCLYFIEQCDMDFVSELPASQLQTLLYPFQCSSTQRSTFFDCIQQAHQFAYLFVCFMLKLSTHPQCTTITSPLLLKTDFKDMVNTENIYEACQNLQWNHAFEIILLSSECIQFLSDTIYRP